ncbi:hypothetical protein Tco_0877277 [Tanacetum coccineum]|uniref:Uncharacterized protein n=1 Tax=Tanacetum coccineum TaxID=301880 RepID=A0ABQ5BXC0_9ASTR
MGREDSEDMQWSYLASAGPDDPRPGTSFDMPASLKAIPDYMPWRHPDSIITDLKPAAGSLISQEKSRTRDLILRDSSRNDMAFMIILCLLEEESTKDQEELHHDVRSTLQRLPFYCTPSAAADVVIHDPTPECVAATTPNTKVLAKAEAFKKQKASTFGSALSQVAKHTRSTTSHSSDGSSRPNLFDDHSDDDPDAYVEIPLITLIRFAVTIPLRGNKGEGSTPFAAEGSRGKAITDGCVNIPSGSAIHPHDSISPSSSVQDTAGVAIDKEFFLFLPRPYYADYLEDGIIGGSYEISREEWEHPHEPTFNFLRKELFKDPKVCKTMIDQFPTLGRICLVQKFLASDEFSRVQGELLSLATSGRLLRATPLIATMDYPFLNKIVDHSAHPLSVLLELEPEKLARPAPVSAPKQPSQEQNEEWVNAMVNTPDEEMVDSTIGKLAEVLVQGVVRQVCQDVNQADASLIQDSELAYSGSPNVIAALFVEKEKEDTPPTPKILLARGLSGLILLLHSRICIVTFGSGAFLVTSFRSRVSASILRVKALGRCGDSNQ